MNTKRYHRNLHILNLVVLICSGALGFFTTKFALLYLDISAHKSITIMAIGLVILFFVFYLADKVENILRKKA
jgi:hypothetical protein